MSEQTNMNQEIKLFLTKIEENLPGWIKDKKEECKEVLNNIEQHIWDNAESIAQGGPIALHHVQQAIQQMGSAKAIGAEYKRRGTPKVYITNELWPYYVKVLQVVVGIVLGLSILGFFLSDFQNNIGAKIWDLLSGMWSGSIQAILFVSLIFVGLSMEGYLPEDFDEEKSKKEKSTQAEKKVIKSPIQIDELIFGGIIGIIVGLIAINQPIPSFFNLFSDQFLGYVKIFGTLMVFTGILNLIRGFIGQRMIIWHQLLNFGTIILSLVGVSLLFEMSAIWFPILLKVIGWFAIIGNVVECFETLFWKSKFDKYIQYKNI
jgi:hypothetical protein